MGKAARAGDGTKIVLGQRYRDEVTGFEGIAVGLFSYLFACDRVQLESDATPDGTVKAHVVDAPALVKIDGRTFDPEAAIAEAGGKTGGPGLGTELRDGPDPR